MPLAAGVHKYLMRFYEFASLPSPKPITPIKPLSPTQARLKGLKQNIDNGRKQLQAERDRQRQKIENERKRLLVHPTSI
jgi:hypothetical protein